MAGPHPSSQRQPQGGLLAATTLAGSLAALATPTVAAHAQSAAQLQTIETEIKALQTELQRMKHELAARDGQVRAAQQQASQARAAAQQAQTQATAAATTVQQQAPAVAAAAAAAVETAESKGPPGTFHVGGVTVTLGGYIEAAGIYRSRNEVADIGSNLNTGIPLPNSQLYHEDEVRGSARQSRISLLVNGKPNDVTNLAAYFETDFIGAAPTANSAESNSYNLRLRQAYATYDRSDLGLHVLGGQAWSLLTMDKAGITARQEYIPLTIDAQYLPGFTWTRNTQIRVVKDFDQKYWIAASLESPQGNFYVGPNGTGTPAGSTLNSSNPGGSGYFSGNSYSADVAPDIIIKAAADPGFGHYEIYGLARFLHTRLSATGSGVDHTVLAGGGGAAVLLPVVPKYLDLQASFLAGAGIGRYGSAQLPDATIGPDGSPKPLTEVEAMIGLVGHPIPAIDVYGYVGTEQIDRKDFKEGTKGYGYGSPLYSNTTCNTELGSTTTCVANTSGVTQGTIGTWYRFYDGSFGKMQVGAQYSYTKRQIFSAVGGAPSTNENIVMVSFRYYPFR